jgi:phage terminase small subunit
MLVRGGQRPTPTLIKLARGNPGKRPLPEAEPMPENPPVMPKWLEGRGAQLWDELVRVAFWLREPDSYKLAAWCDRQAEYEKPECRAEWTAADRREHRSLGSELGLDPSSRARMGMVRNAKKATGAGQFFTG